MLENVTANDFLVFLNNSLSKPKKSQCEGNAFSLLDNCISVLHCIPEAKGTNFVVTEHLACGPTIDHHRVLWYKNDDDAVQVDLNGSHYLGNMYAEGFNAPSFDT